jgi:hypothetical protein
MMTTILIARCSEVQMKYSSSTDVSEGSQRRDIRVGYTTIGLNNIVYRWPLNKYRVDTGQVMFSFKIK